MIRETREGIVKNAEWPWLVYGDGYMAKISQMVYSKNAEGLAIWKMKVMPIEELTRAHEIGLEMTDENGCVNVEYPVNYIIALNEDPAFKVYFCFLNFWSIPSASIEVLQGFKDKTKVEELLKQIRLLRAELAYTQERYEKAKVDVRRYIREEIAEPMDDLNIKPQQNGPQIVSPVRTE